MPYNSNNPVELIQRTSAASGIVSDRQSSRPRLSTIFVHCSPHFSHTQSLPLRSSVPPTSRYPSSRPKIIQPSQLQQYQFQQSHLQQSQLQQYQLQQYQLQLQQSQKLKLLFYNPKKPVYSDNSTNTRQRLPARADPTTPVAVIQSINAPTAPSSLNSNSNPATPLPAILPTKSHHPNQIPSATSTTSTGQTMSANRSIQLQPVPLAPAPADGKSCTGNGGSESKNCVLRDEDMAEIAKKFNVGEQSARQIFSSPDGLKNMRIADLKTIATYLGEKKSIVVKLSGKKENQLNTIKQVIWPNLAASNTPIAPPAVNLSSREPSWSQLATFYSHITSLAFFCRERELFTRVLDAPNTLDYVLPFAVRVPMIRLLPLLEGEMDVVKPQDKRNRAHLYFFSATHSRVLEAKAVMENGCRCNNIPMKLEPYEVNAGFEHVDITNFLNWQIIRDFAARGTDDSPASDVILHLELPRKVFTHGYMALWQVKRLAVKELVAKVYLDTMNAYLDQEPNMDEKDAEDDQMVVQESEASNEDLVARVERMFVSRVVDDEKEKDKERENAKKDQNGANDEGEIEMGDQTVSFHDPLVLSRIRHPARGKDCGHRSCFDLESFLRFNERKTNWQCACCFKVVTVESLIIDTKFKNYLNKYPTADRCVVHSDGSTSVPTTASNSSLSSSTTSSTASSSSPSRNSTPLSSDCGNGDAAARGNKKRKIGQIEVISLEDSDQDDNECVGPDSRARKSGQKGRTVNGRRPSEPAKGAGRKDVPIIVLDDD